MYGPNDVPLKCHEQVQQSMFWMLHTKASDKGKTKLGSQLVAKSQKKQVSCFGGARYLSRPVLHPLPPPPFHFKDLASFGDTLKSSEKSMFLRRRGKIEGCECLCRVFSWHKKAGSYKREN